LGIAATGATGNNRNWRFVLDRTPDAWAWRNEDFTPL
jgi:hypothetical protein